MSETLKCAKCGAENPKSNKFCDTCGYKLSAAAVEVKKAPAVSTAVVQAAPEKKKAKKEEREVETYIAVSGSKGAAALPFNISWETVIWAVIILVGIITRFYDLGTKPMHHDESMHAFYGWKLYMGDGYSYNPMLHGPFLFHTNALIYFLFGATDYTARIMPAFYGMITICIMWFYKPYLGKIGAMVAAFLIAVSPTFMYQARYIRNDIYIAGDTLMIVLGLLRYFDTRKPGWLFLAAVGLALSWATKEVTYITLAIFGSFFFFRWIWEYSLRNVPDKFAEENKVFGAVEYWLTKKGKWVFINAFILFFAIHAFFYFNKQGGVSFWQNLKGVWDGYTWALTYWLGQHGVERGSQPMYFYALLIPFYEMVSVLFMLIASGYYLYKEEKRSLVNVFLIYWWIMALLIYSWAGERMPWLALHPLTPMTLLAGKFIADIFERKDWGWKRTAGIAAFVITAAMSWHGAVHVCFYGDGADPKESLIYVQSSTDTTEVSEKIIKFAHEMKRMNWESNAFRTYDPYNLEIVCEDYCTWPFAWYLRDFKKIAYQPKNIPDHEKGKPIILSGIEEANRGHDQRVYDLLKDDYSVTRYKLREWWAPDEKKWWNAPLFSKPNQPGKIEMMWDRFMYRSVWNDLGSYDMVVYIRKDLEKYWR